MSEARSVSEARPVSEARSFPCVCCGLNTQRRETQ